MNESVVLRLADIQTPGELQRLLFETFHLPGWYGFNWNAFEDSILDPEQSTLPAILVVRGWAQLASRMTQNAGQLRDILEAAASQRGCRIEWEE